MHSAVKLSFFYKIILILVISFSVHFSPNALAAKGTDLHYEKALSAYKEENFDESMIHLKNALQASPDNLPSKILMGELLAQLGQFNAAEVEFDEAMSQGADVSLFADTWGAVLMRLKDYQEIIDFNLFTGFTKIQQLDWQRLRSTACMQVKDYDCATESFYNIGQLSTDKTEQFNGLANIELSKKNYTKAQSYLQQAGDINPENAITWQLRGLVARNQNNLSLSLSYLQKAFELSPDNPYILRNLADVYLASNNNEAAKKTINSILDASPEDPFAILVNSWLQKDTALEAQAESKFNELADRINNFPTELVAQEQSLLFLRALIAFRQQNFEQATRDFTALRKLDDDDISPIILLAKSYIALGKEKDAIAVLENNQQELATLPDILVMLGDLYINSGRNFKALTLLQTLNTDYAGNVQVRLLGAKLEVARGKTSQGLNSLDELASEYPNNEVVLFVHSVLNLQAHQYLKADTSITRLIKLRPDDAIKLNIKGAILIKLNQLDEAKDYITQALSVNPNLLSAKYNLATVLYLQKEIEQTLVLLEDILKENPRYPSALLLLAKIQFSKQQYDDAQENYRKILIDNKQSIEALEGLTSLHLAKNEKQEAIFQLSKLSKIQSDNPKYIIQKAQVYLALDDKENSQREIQTLRLFSQDDAALMIALSKLQLLADDLSGAIKSLESAQSLQPNSLSVGVQLAELLLNNNLTADATTQIKLLVKTFSQSPQVSFLQGRLAEQQGEISQASHFYIATLNKDDQFELALAKLYTLIDKGLPPQIFKTQIDKIVDKYPERYFPRNLLAQFYFYQKDYTQAATHYEQLLNHKDLPNRAAMLNRLANIYMPSDSVKSIQIAKQAYELDNTNSQILTTYGWLLTQQGQPKLGLELLRKAFSRSQQNPALHYYIAVSLDKLELSREAISELDSLFQRKQSFDEKSQAQALYDRLIKD
jgi:putative PEP-CTERM system TPR-repeat lipoprotein